MDEQIVWSGARIVLVQGDIAAQDTDAVVNAANTGLVPGAGVDGAIRRAAGPEVTRATQAIRERSGSVEPLPTGEAVSTTAGGLRARRIIHTAGPVYRGGTQGEPALLASCYRSCLEAAVAEGLRSLSFPALSTGIYGYPLREGAEIALSTVRKELNSLRGRLEEIRFVLFDADAVAVYREALAELNG